LKAQQQNQYSQMMLNKYAFNPAYAGLDFSLSANFMYRNQWEGLPSNPTDIHINAHMPMYVWSGAVGGMIERQSFGVLTQTSLLGSYNYITDTSLGLLSFGGRIGFSQLSIDGSAIVTPEGIYEGGFSHNDPILLEGQDQGIGLKWNFGTYFYNKKMEFGLAISNVPGLKIGLENTSFGQKTHLNTYFQYNFVVNEEIELMQSILLKTDLNKIQSDVSSLFKINGNIFGGISLRGYSSRSFDAIVLIAGMKLSDHYTLSYSYDIGLSSLRMGHEGSHEILLNYNLRKLIGTGQPPKIIYNPRYL
jgi:type IX secretion system PorP/SprF family membrane protein